MLQKFLRVDRQGKTAFYLKVYVAACPKTFQHSKFSVKLTKSWEMFVHLRVSKVQKF